MGKDSGSYLLKSMLIPPPLGIFHLKMKIYYPEKKWHVTAKIHCVAWLERIPRPLKRNSDSMGVKIVSVYTNSHIHFYFIANNAQMHVPVLIVPIYANIFPTFKSAFLKNKKTVFQIFQDFHLIIFDPAEISLLQQTGRIVTAVTV